MNKRIVIAGGGAAGFFAAITAAEACPENTVTILDRSSQVLSKVRISGGGRCNVTHACFDPRELSTRYPRGGRALIGAFQRFQPRDTIAWFAFRGVRLKTEADGRMFPETNHSETIVECLTDAARAAGVKVELQTGLESVSRNTNGTFILRITGGRAMECDRLLLATGGPRSGSSLAAALGHTVVEPVPSLFTFNIKSDWLRRLPGVAAGNVEVSAANRKEQGPLLITHNGVSGPAVLRLSAWQARQLHDLDYRFELRINWVPSHRPDALRNQLQAERLAQPGRLVVNTPLFGLPTRLWEALALEAGVLPTTRWAILERKAQENLIGLLQCTRLDVEGKSLNKDEFVTCGGVELSEVDFKTMQSRICPGLYFAGELLDIDGVTGGFNFQAAWTTGWIAGSSM